MQKIVDYEILDFSHSEHVVLHAKQGLIKGWQPYGELKVVRVNDNDDVRLFQVMVLYEEQE